MRIIPLLTKFPSVFVVAAFLLAIVITYSLPLPLASQTKATIAITLFAMTVWVSEIIPLHATALLVAFVLVVFGRFSVDAVFAQFFDRVVVLVLGGFVLAVAMRKHKLDEYIGYKILHAFGESPRAVLFGMIFVTSFLSMWMSNSAAAAIMLPIAIVILKKNGMRKGISLFGKALVLGVAYGATIGGIGTVIGSTPNVISQKFLTEKGIAFGFVEWGLRGFPIMILMVIICWVVLLFLFRPETNRLTIEKYCHILTTGQKKVGVIFLITVFLWVTEGLHGIHNSIIAIVPIILLYLFNLIDTNDFHKIGWDALILIGGGIALGMAIDKSGVDDIISFSLLSVIAGLPYFFILLALGIVGVGLTSFLSNTAASAVFIPIITSLSQQLGLDTTNLVVAAAIGVSMDFIFPMGTPPSALAFLTGYIRMNEMIKAGLFLSLAGTLILALIAKSLWGVF